MADPNAKLSVDELSSQYGYAAGFFNSDPELKALIDQAVKEQWTTDKFKAKLISTQWYRNRSASERTFSELQIRDPHEALRQLDNQRTTVANMAGNLGIDLNGKDLEFYTQKSLSQGWSNELLQFWLSHDHPVTPGQTSGQAATLETQIRGLAGDYGVTVSDQDVARLIGQVQQGHFTQDNLQDFVRDQARSKYPGMRGYLDQGFTVRQVASPYTQSYAQILEVDPSSVDLNDSHVQKALQGTPDPKSGQAVMQSVYDFERTLRQDPRWQYTKNAHDQLTTVGQGILKDMGLYS